MERSKMTEQLNQHMDYCQNCSRNLGINYEKAFKPTTQPGDNGITGRISTTSMGIAIPYKFSECHHFVCQECKDSCECDDPFKKCPVPGCHIGYFQDYEIAVELLGSTLLKSNQNHFIEINFDLNRKNTLYNNNKNKKAIGADLSRYLLRCGTCPKYYRGSNPASFKPNLVDTCCFNCLTFSCNLCFKRLHNKDPKITIHQPRPVLNCPIESLNCPVHAQQKLVYYCQEKQRMKCELCYTKALATNTNSKSYLMLYSKQMRLEMILSYKREFEACKTSAQMALKKVKDDIDQLIPEHVKEAEEISWLIKNDKTEHLRKLRNKESEFEQVLVMIGYIYEELHALEVDLGNVMFSTDEDNLPKMLGKYLQLLGMAENQQRHNSNNSLFAQRLNNNSAPISFYENTKCLNESYNSLNMASTYSYPTASRSKHDTSVNKIKKFLHNKNKGSLSSLASIPTSNGVWTPLDMNNNQMFQENTKSSRHLQSKQSCSTPIDHVLDMEYDTEYLSTDDNLDPVDSDHRPKKKQYHTSKSNISVVDRRAGPLDFMEQCTVQAVEGMNCMWVRFARDNSAWNKLHHQLSVWLYNDSNGRRFEEPEVAYLQVGDLVAYRHTINSRDNDTIWTRAKITEISHTEVPNSTTFQLLLIDLGVTIDKLQSKKLRRLQQQHKDIIPLAYRCHMHNLIAYDKHESTLEAKRLLLNWIHVNGNLSAHVISKTDTSLGIDLIANAPSEKYYTYIRKMVSLRVSEVLVKTKLAMYETRLNEHVLDEDYERQWLERMPPFIPMQTFNLEETVLGGVSNLERLNEFHMRRLFPDNDSDDSFASLSQRINEEYKRGTTQHLNFFDPVVGMGVAAYYLADQTWQRAEIVKIHEGTGTLDVLYVDYGNTKTISLSQVRYLHKNFFIDEISIFTCRLFGIQFNDDKALQEASNIFYHYMEDIVASVKTVKQIKVLIKRVERVLEPIASTLKYIYDVVIRFPIKEKLTNFNILANKLGFAEITNLAIYDGEEKPEKAATRADETKMCQKQPGVTRLQKEVAKLCLDLPNKIVKKTPATKVLCKVTNVVSPDEFWVQDVVDADDGYYQSFQQELSEKYTSIWEANDVEISRNNSWKMGDLCVIKARYCKNFYRAKLIEKQPGHTFRAIYLDIGTYEENVESAHIFRLIEAFREKPAFKAKKCRMIGIWPSGTVNGEWSNLAKSFIDECLMESYIYVDYKSAEKKREEDDSHEVDVFCCCQNNTQKQFINFADVLNSNGLAFLQDKKKSIDMLLAKRSALREGLKIPSLDSEQKYCNKPECLDKQRQYDVVVTHMDLESGEIFLQIYTGSKTPRTLSKMQSEFQSFYPNTPDINYPVDFLKAILTNNPNSEALTSPTSGTSSFHQSPPVTANHNQQACVCHIRGKYYRCRLNSFDVNTFAPIDKFLVTSIDYGFHELVHITDIFPPMLQFLDIKPQAISFQFSQSVDTSFRNEYMQELSNVLYNKLARLKITAINDLANGQFVISGDLYDTGSNKWCSYYLNKSKRSQICEIQSYLMSDSEQIVEGVFKPFELPSDCETRAFRSIVTWNNPESQLLWLQFDPDIMNELDSESINEPAVAHNIRAYIDMQDSFEVETLDIMPIEQVIPNQPCCSLYDEDQSIYRSFITDVNLINDTATIQYVDYGNVSEVPLDNIFKLNEKYLELPKHAICSRLNQVFIRKDNEHLSQYETLLVENGPGGIFSVLQLETVNQKLFAMFVKEKESGDDVNYETLVNIYIGDESEHCLEQGSHILNNSDVVRLF